MLKTLNIKNLTVFPEADFEFSPGLNVIIGENGTGKTHLLKLGYLFSNAWHDLVKDQSAVSEQKIQSYFSERLRHLFKPDKIGSLTTTGSDGKTELSCTLVGSIPTISIRMPHEPQPQPLADELVWQMAFSNRSKQHVNVDRMVRNADYGKAVYLPCKEMVSFFEGFLALYEKHELQFDETYKDLALYLSTPKLKTAPAMIQEALADLSSDVGGRLILDGGKFYLVSNGSKRREITLVAEGIRKIVTLLHLIENGSLAEGDTLFWDEPESNLNSKLIRAVAAAIFGLCNSGVQVIIATHSLFLLRELEILASRSEHEGVRQRYFALERSEALVAVHQGNTIDDVDPVVMLDEDLLQSDRFMALGDS